MSENAIAQAQSYQMNSQTRPTNDAIDLLAPRRIHVRFLGSVLIIFGLFLAYLLLEFWPYIEKGATGSSESHVVLFDFIRGGWLLSMKLDTQLILLVMIAGAMGSFVHIATSFSDYVGNDRLSLSWLWWYLLRPFIGMTLAAIFYVAIRGGFLGTGDQSGDINPYGVAALAGLVGMFSKQATDKLNEVFDTLFKTDKGDAKRKNSLDNPVPVVSNVEPQTIEPKTQSPVVAITGSSFVNGATVSVNGTNRETEFISKTRLRATLLTTDVDKEGELELTVLNPEPGGGRSTPIKLKIASGLEGGLNR